MSNDHHGHADHGDGYHVHPHVSSTKSNLIILGILFLLTGLTVAAYRVRLGDANLFIALLIATIKAIFVGTFFMHLKHEKPFNTLLFVGTLAFIGVFFFFTYNDTAHRGEIDGRSGMRFDYRTQEYAAGSAAGYADRGGELAPIPAPAEGGEAHGEDAEHAAEGGH